MSTTEVKSFCRICIGACGMVLTLDENRRIVAIRGDKDHPASQGYVCVKGLQAPAAHNGPQRLTGAHKRMPDGTFQRIALEQALDEIAEHLRRIIERDGPEAVAAFRGTQSGLNTTANYMLPAWLAAIGSPSFFSTMTVDQSAKWVTVERLGAWAAGRHPFHDSDVLMVIGGNPLVSISTVGFDTINVAKRIKEAKARGTKLIVIDPRLTETARHADLFLQPRPGEDPAIVAGMLRIILSEGWEDREFCARYVDDLAGLRRAVEPFTAQYVEARAGLPAGQLRAAAQLFAGPAKRGAAMGGTGPDMAAHSNLAEHLIECLNVVCGRYLREGERVPNPGVLSPPKPRRARVIPPRRSWEKGRKSRIRGVGILFGEMMAGIMADEIMEPGKGQIKALIVDGGNPVNSLPDQYKTVRALRSLELLVTIDPIMSNTAKLSHYVIAPRLQYERADLPTTREYETLFFQVPFSQFTPGVAEPPPGAEVADDWYVFWALAKRLGREIIYDGVALDMKRPPATEDLIAIATRNSRVPLDEIRKYPGGKIFDADPQYIEPAKDGGGRFAVIPPDVAAELAAVRAEAIDPSGATISNGQSFTHRLSVRRMREVSNTMYQELPAIRRRRPYNPAWMNPRDLAALGLAAGDQVELISDHGRIRAIVQDDETVRAGVVSMSHGWGPLPGEAMNCATAGSSTSLLVSSERDCEPINAMPRQSAIPVNIVRMRR